MTNWTDFNIINTLYIHNKEVNIKFVVHHIASIKSFSKY